MIERVRDDISEKASTVGEEMSALGWLIRTAVIAAVGGAIYQEMRKPSAERTGSVGGTNSATVRLPSMASWNQRPSR